MPDGNSLDRANRNESLISTVMVNKPQFNVVVNTELNVRKVGISSTKLGLLLSSSCGVVSRGCCPRAVIKVVNYVRWSVGVRLV